MSSFFGADNTGKWVTKNRDRGQRELEDVEG